MEKVLGFIKSYYLIFFFSGIFFLLALIGYLYDKHQHRDFTVKEKKPKKDKNTKANPKEQAQTPQVPEQPQTPQESQQPVQPVPENITAPVQEVPEQPVSSVQPVQPEPTPEALAPEGEGMNMEVPMDDINK